MGGEIRKVVGNKTIKRFKQKKLVREAQVQDLEQSLLKMRSRVEEATMARIAELKWTSAGPN